MKRLVYLISPNKINQNFYKTHPLITSLENITFDPRQASDLIEELPNTYGNDVDIMVEAKHKELAIEGFIK